MLKKNSVNGADFADLDTESVVRDLGFTVFVAKKLVALRNTFLAEGSYLAATKVSLKTGMCMMKWFVFRTTLRNGIATVNCWDFASGTVFVGGILTFLK